MADDAKKYTWADLKAFVNGLPDDELDQPIIWWGEERGGAINNASCLEEDYGENGGDYQEPRSAYENEVDYVEEEFEVDYPKGTPILWTD